MKKLLISLIALFMLVGIAQASPLATEATVSVGFTGIDVGTFLDMKNDNQILVGATMPMIGFKKILTANGGVLTDWNTRPIIIGSLDVNVKNLMALWGWDFWLLDPLKVGGWLGNDIESTSKGLRLGKAHGGIYANIELPLPAFLQ